MHLDMDLYLSQDPSTANYNETTLISSDLTAMRESETRRWAKRRGRRKVCWTQRRKRKGENGRQ